MIKEYNKLKTRIRLLLVFFIVALALSGITAFPLEIELNLLQHYADQILDENNSLRMWIVKVHEGVHNTNLKYPFIAYGTDWLAFAHIVIAIAFIGPIIDPVKNIWVIQFGIIACLLILPLALIAGEIRDIPFYWRLIDCSFGIIGIFPLMLTYHYTKKLEKYEIYNEKPEVKFG
ncbi:MAG: hypothetical protein ACK40G_18005 [Cytophagaceae bacterium]